MKVQRINKERSYICFPHSKSNRFGHIYKQISGVMPFYLSYFRFYILTQVDLLYSHNAITTLTKLILIPWYHVITSSYSNHSICLKQILSRDVSKSGPKTPLFYLLSLHSLNFHFLYFCLLHHLGEVNTEIFPTFKHTHTHTNACPYFQLLSYGSLYLFKPNKKQKQWPVLVYLLVYSSKTLTTTS